MKCSGVHIATGEPIEISFGNLITGIDPVFETLEAPDFLSPGWIDLQVNGFAGVDYNSAEAPHEGIGASIREMFRTGVTSFFPTVITGSPDAMLGALRNL